MHSEVSNYNAVARQQHRCVNHLSVQLLLSQTVCGFCLVCFIVVILHAYHKDHSEVFAKLHGWLFEREKSVFDGDKKNLTRGDAS